MLRNKKILISLGVLAIILIFACLLLRYRNIMYKVEHANQTYNSFLDFPYDNMVFADTKTYQIIKQAYDEVEFFSEFKKGDLDVYDLYKDKYLQLLNNEVSFTESIAGNVLYFEKYIKDNIFSTKSLEDYIYYFFDIDDGLVSIA